MTKMKVFKWIWAWEDEKEEAWLREMSQKGWHLLGCALPGFYTFEHGEPKDYVYRLDYFTDNQNKGNYLELFLDADWQYLGQMGSWQYFRKEALNGEVPEIFSDNESKAKKYQRILLLLLAVTPIQVINLVNFNHNDGTFFMIFRFITLFFALFLLYGITKLALRIRELKQKV